MSDAALLEVLEEARRRGHLGAASAARHVEQARRLGQAVRRPVSVAVDLGSGGGLPGLVLALDWPDVEWTLVDRRRTRADDLLRAVGRLGLADRVHVVGADAADFARDPANRGRADLVTAKSLGAPAEVAELAAPLLRVGGQLLVAEPPSPGADRWSTAGLALVGLERDPAPAAEMASPPDTASFTQRTICAGGYPRRRRRPPLWASST